MDANEFACGRRHDLGSTAMSPIRRRPRVSGRGGSLNRDGISRHRERTTAAGFAITWRTAIGTGFNFPRGRENIRSERILTCFAAALSPQGADSSVRILLPGNASVQEGRDPNSRFFLNKCGAASED